MAYWLLKSEPGTYSWDRMVTDRRTFWDGVRNPQATSNLKAMKRGDRAFFYHSGAAPAVVGIVEIVKEYYPDPGDKSGRFGMVDVEAVQPMKTPVSLTQIKAEPKLATLALVRQGRLSVVPIDSAAWKMICAMGGVKA
jgi:predicted RNA-binding protein with PUA-like domain